jgi:hypothetical protein
MPRRVAFNVDGPASQCPGKHARRPAEAGANVYTSDVEVMRAATARSRTAWTPPGWC